MPLPPSLRILAVIVVLTTAFAFHARTAAAHAVIIDSVPAVDAVVTRDDVKYAKPDPDLFVAAAAKLNVPITGAIVIGDSIWDMLAARRCQALGVGLLSGGYGLDELERAGAYRVYEDPADLLDHLDEVGGRR